MKKLVFTAFAIGLSLTASVLGQVPNYVPTNGLVGYWPFNGNANDESGNGNNGTVNGATLTTDRFGVASKAYSFDGFDDYIQLNYIDILSNQNRSISFFTKLNDVNLSSDISAISYGGNSTNCSQAGGDVECGFFNLNNFASARIDGTCTATYSNYTVQDTQWHHVVFTFDNVLGNEFNFFKIYIDGLLVSIGTYNGTTTLNTLSLSNLVFGKSNKTSRFFDGSLDDIGIWNRALTDCEIQDLYHSQLGSQAINAGADQTICKGDNFTLQALGGINYQWNNNVIDGQAFSPVQTNNYIVQGTDSVGCVGTDSVLVSVLEHSASTLNETALDAFTLNGQTYTQSGTYTQTIPAANGCDSIITLNLTLNFTGIGDQEAEPLTIYPNPTTKHITIDNGNFAAMAGYSIKIENNAGQQVFQSAINQAQFYVDLSTWTGNGLYFVHLIDPQNNTVTVRKIVLQ